MFSAANCLYDDDKLDDKLMDIINGYSNGRNDDIDEINFITEENFKNINPYMEYYAKQKLTCDYVVAVPDYPEQNEKRIIPPPKEILKVVFQYTTKEGKQVKLDHPIPPDLPIDALSENHEYQENPTDPELQPVSSENMCGMICVGSNVEIVEVLEYLFILVIPLLAFLFYHIEKKKNKKVAESFLYIMFLSFIIHGITLFVCLL